MGIDQGKIRASHNTVTEPLKAHSQSDNESLPSSTNAKMWAMPKPTVVGERIERNGGGDVRRIGTTMVHEYTGWELPRDLVAAEGCVRL
ncbi:hypothetical protein V490_05822 [Pseudogymnoascus sp. VKM F-3557]|nr:hypothetical protein V490_05822 [Pseudogymnoascus sp. VKM F-3557]